MLMNASGKCCLVKVSLCSKLKMNTYSTSLASNFSIKDALSGLRQLLAIESPLKVVKNTFYFTLKHQNSFQNSGRYNLGNKQFQYTYCQISQEGKAISQ